MSLLDKLNEIKAGFAEKAPEEAKQIMGAHTQLLVDQGRAAKALGVGEPLPRFALPDQTGKLVSSTELIGAGPVVLSVYRGRW